jgi:hypothetical protein
MTMMKLANATAVFEGLEERLLLDSSPNLVVSNIRLDGPAIAG